MATPTIRHRTRWVIFALIVCAAATIGLRLATLDGILNSVRISGPSMAEALLGEHYAIVCEVCSRPIRCDAASSEGAIFGCPNCGGKNEVRSDSQIVPGQRVVIDRAAYWLSSPERWDVVAFRRGDELGVKRIVALPGEKLSIRKGDLFIDDAMLNKSYPLFRQMAIVVHDDRYLAAGQTSSWRSSGERIGWRRSDKDGEWSCSAIDAKPDWLEYHHRSPVLLAGGHESSVKDYDSYNPSLARPLNDVVDLLVECRCELSDDARILLRLHSGEHHWQAEVSRTSVSLFQDDRQMKQHPLPRRESYVIAFGHRDERIMLVVDDQVMIEEATSMKSDQPMLRSTPFALAAQGSGQVSLSDLKILRDVYYLDPDGLARDWSLEALPANSYAVLGDNAPVSMDSRQSQQGVSKSDVVGKVSLR